MLRPGTVSASVSGHFGELLQGRLGEMGPVALITLPCPDLSMKGWMRPASSLRLHGPDRLMTPAAARRFLSKLGVQPRGEFRLRAGMPAGGGAGASTAALVAIARLAAPDQTSDAVARACLEIEGASDPLMYDTPETLLWASREARIVDVMPPLPRFEVLGGFFGPPRNTCAEDINFADISDLIVPWRVAAEAGNLATLAGLSSQAADRTLRCRGPADDPTTDLARELGALGYVIAHTGSARGLVFAPGTVPERGPAALREAGLRRMVRFRAGGQDVAPPWHWR